METASTAVVTLAVERRGLGELPGSGFLVPPVEGRTIKASTFSASKWAWTGGLSRDVVHLRASLGRAREEAVLQRRTEGSGGFFGARLTDRYGDNGLIAAVALGFAEDGRWSIDNFVLSCRVFSREVEDAIVVLVLRAAAAAGAGSVTARFRGTAKNARFADFYPRLGFGAEPAPDGSDALHFRHDLAGIAPLPRWIGVTDDEGAFHVR